MHMLTMLVALYFAVLVSAAASPRDWAALNLTVGGRLLQHAPYARPCFKLSNATTGTFSASECTVIRQNYNVSALRVNNPGSYEGSQWEGCPATSQNCLLDSLDPSDPTAFAPPRVCQQGGVPSYFINVEQASDVQAAFKFVSRTGVELVVKNTGHDYQGRSARPGSLALWTNNLKNITFNPSFKPTGCSSAAPQPVVTVQAGIVFNELYAFGEANNLTLPGGGCGTVGAVGGYSQGGGHSALSNTFGLAVDRSVEYRVVVPTGQFLIANECQNTDLYFALRGGGGGTFGVVLEVVTMAFPQTPVHAFVIEDVPADTDSVRAFFSVLLNNSIHLAQSGWGGYASARGMTYLNPLAISDNQAAADVAALRSFAKSVNATIIEETLPSFVTFFKLFVVTQFSFQSSGGLTAIGSRLLPTKNFETNESRSELLDAILAAQEGHEAAFFFAVAPFAHKANGQTSVTPAWRESIAILEIADAWNFDTTPAEQSAILSALTASIDILRKITPGGGTYINESDLHEPDFEASFWGENFDKLLSIKKKYDPLHILDCWHCIGFEGPQDPKFQCYI